MGDQHLAIRIGDALVVAVIVDVPETTDDVVHDEVSARLEGGDPILVGAIDRADRGGGHAVFRRVSDGHPAVVEEVRKEVEEAGQDARGGDAADRILVETRRRGDVNLGGLPGEEIRVQCFVDDGADGGQEDIRFREEHIQSIGGLTRERSGGVHHVGLEDQTGGLTGRGVPVRIIIARCRIRALPQGRLDEQRQPTAKQKAHHERKMVPLKIRKDSGIPSGRAAFEVHDRLGSLFGKRLIRQQKSPESPGFFFVARERLELSTSGL